jgi:hypothetical protein
MRGAGDGQKFSKALHNGKQHNMKQCHGVILSMAYESGSGLHDLK